MSWTVTDKLATLLMPLKFLVGSDAQNRLNNERNIKLISRLTSGKDRIYFETKI
jgi:hypothetical protein